MGSQGVYNDATTTTKKQTNVIIEYLNGKISDQGQGKGYPREMAIFHKASVDGFLLIQGLSNIGI